MEVLILIILIIWGASSVGYWVINGIEEYRKMYKENIKRKDIG